MHKKYNFSRFGSLVLPCVRIDQYLVTVGIFRKHALALNPPAYAATKQPEKERRRVQLAVYQATSSRPLALQKMLWMRSMQPINSCAWSRLTSTLTAEQSLAAFQNVS